MLTSALCDVSASVYVIVTLKFQTSSHYLLLTFKLWCYVYRFLWCYFILSTLHTLDEELLAVTLENLAVAVVSGILLHIYYRLSTLHTPLIESNISIEGGMSFLRSVIVFVHLVGRCSPFPIKLQTCFLFLHVYANSSEHILCTLWCITDLRA